MNRRPAHPLAALLLALAACGAAAAGAHAQGEARLAVSIPDVQDGGPLPVGYTADGRNLSPALSWTGAPPATAGYAVVMRDLDAPSGGVHWIVYGLQRSTTALPRGMHNLAEPTHPLGALQGRNDHGGFGYAGPRPAPGDAPHHYRFEVRALDRPLRLRGGADLKALDRATAGHVVAQGALTTLYPAPPRPDAPPKAGAPGTSPAFASPAPSPPA